MACFNLSGKCMLMPILICIIISYELKTSAFVNFITGKNVEEINNQRIEGEECDRNVVLADYDQFPVVMLSSYPGSGDTFARKIIEDLTGFYTGSIYQEEPKYLEGFVGEYDHTSTGRNIATFSTGIVSMEYAEGVILLVRNPYDAIISDFNRQFSYPNTGTSTKLEFSQSKMWTDYFEGHIKRWGAANMFYAEYANLTKIPIEVIFYEDLVKDNIGEMTKISDFYQKNFDFVPADLVQRLSCISQRTYDVDAVEEMDFELFDQEKIELIETQIESIKAFFEWLKLPAIPSSYNKKSGTSEYNFADMEALMNERQVFKKIKRALEGRKNLIENNLYTFHKFAEKHFLAPFAPFKPLV